MTQSHANSPYTTVACLKAADTILGEDRVWSAVNDAQRGFLDRYVRLVPEIGKVPEILSNATYDPADHVKFLSDNGWEAQIPDCGPEEFLLAAVMSLAGLWQHEGERDWIEKHGGVNAAQLYAGVEVLARRGTGERCARVTTRSGDVVWLEMTPKAPEGLALSIEAQSRFSGDFDPVTDLVGVKFPLIDFAAKVDNDWLVGLNTVTARRNFARILEAKAQFELKANHVGFRARAADEMRGVEECAWSPPPTFTIDEPFIMAVTRPGLSLPLFTAHLSQDAWKDPVDDFLK